MSETLLKLALLKDMEQVIQYQNIFAELSEELFGLLRNVSECYAKAGLEIPDRKHFNAIMERTQKVLEKRAGVKNTLYLPDGSYHGNDPDAKLPEP